MFIVEVSVSVALVVEVSVSVALAVEVTVVELTVVEKLNVKCLLVRSPLGKYSTCLKSPLGRNPNRHHFLSPCNL